jgi:hypothetical protein
MGKSRRYSGDKSSPKMKYNKNGFKNYKGGAKEEIIKPDPEDELAADRLKNAAATKKLAIFDAFEIMKRIEEEEEKLNAPEEKEEKKSSAGFAERRSRK